MIELQLGARLPERAFGPVTLTDIVRYQGASGDLDYNKYNNTFGPYGAFQSTAAGIEQQAYVMSANALAAATP